MIPIGGHIIDGGCYIGDHTIAYSRIGEVVGIDPNIEAIKCCQANVTDAIVMHGYLSDTAGQTSNLRIEPSGNFGASHLSIGESIQSTTIDEITKKYLGGHCDFIKLDLEGYELKALMGGIATIQRCHPMMLIEINQSALKRCGATPDAIFELLRKHSYEWRPLQENQVEQYDLLCR